MHETINLKENHKNVQKYYGEIVTNTRQLKTSACCTDEAIPNWQKRILSQIEPEILEKFYGCGSPIPEELEGKTVLDLGCGTGRDVFIVSKLVGPEGFVIGIDMTENQLAVANKYLKRQTEKFGYSKPNVVFKKGLIEDLKSAEIQDNSIDVVISNCVINLADDKFAVFKEIFRVLKPGGELYFSDVFSGRRIPEYLKQDPVLYGECLSNALYIEDFRRILRQIGCLDFRVKSKRKLELNSDEIEEKIGMIDFYSYTIRAFKLNDLEDICEDYGQSAIYKGTIVNNPHKFVLDDHHTFITGKPKLVCGNTASMLQNTRFSEHFEISGNRKTHFGPFDCSSSDKIQSADDSCTSCC